MILLILIGRIQKLGNKKATLIRVAWERNISIYFGKKRIYFAIQKPYPRINDRIIVTIFLITEIFTNKTKSY
jgi:hypothetical protein